MNYLEYLETTYGKSVADNYSNLSTLPKSNKPKSKPKTATIINDLISYNNETKTMKEWAKELKITPNSFKYRYLNWGICERLFRKKSQTHPNIKLITWQSETYSEAEWARKLGINTIEFQNRLKKWGYDYLTFAPSCPFDNRFIVWAGKKQTKWRWAKEIGIDYSTFISRLKRYGVCDRIFIKKNGNILK